jgi:MFS family permease
MYKYYVLFLLCLLAFTVQCEQIVNPRSVCPAANESTVGAGMVPPAFGTLAKKFDVTNQQASYFTTSYILFTGVVPLLVTPFVNIYGRRPAYLVGGRVPHKVIFH